MKEELNKEQAKKDLIYTAKNIKKAADSLEGAYKRIIEIYEGI